jgi:hypothetical protein
MPRLEELHDDLLDRLKEAKDQGWLGEVAAIETSAAAAEDKLASMRELAAKHTTTNLGMPDFHPTVGRRTPAADTHRPEPGHDTPNVTSAQEFLQSPTVNE